MIKIARLKHFPYIASYHGPWLSLPPEILDSLFALNLQQNPNAINPDIFLNLAIIRNLVDEASELAIKAAPSVLQNTGISVTRQKRLLQLAVVKLAKAYAIDEIGTSVLVMQCTALDDIADKVLKKDPHNVDAKYVSFFHEKIPSRLFRD